MNKYHKKIDTKYIFKLLTALVLLVFGLAWFGFFDFFVFSPFGRFPVFDDPPWGLSKEELLKSKNQPYRFFNHHGNEGYVYDEEILGYSATINYIFHGEKLNHIYINIPSRRWSRHQWDNFMKSLKKHLIATIGRSHICEDSRSYFDDTAEAIVKFRRGRTYGAIYSNSPNGLNSSAGFSLYDGLSPDTKNKVSFSVCPFYGEFKCGDRVKKIYARTITPAIK